MRGVRAALVWLLAASQLTACRFQASGAGTEDDDDSDLTAGASSSNPSTTRDTTGSSSSAGPTSTTDNAGTTDLATSGASSTTAVDACDDPPFFSEVVVLEDAALGAGMMTSSHVFGEYAYSEVEDVGEVTFPFDVPCNDTYYLWALVWDQNRDPFENFGNADTFTATVDAGTEFSWSYGCQTLFQVEPWSYERVQIAEPMSCSVETPQVFALAPGVHQLVLRNLESGSFGSERDGPGNVAAVARVFVTNDPDYVPDPDTQ